MTTPAENAWFDEEQLVGVLRTGVKLIPLVEGIAAHASLLATMVPDAGTNIAGAVLDVLASIRDYMGKTYEVPTKEDAVLAYRVFLRKTLDDMYLLGPEE